MRYNQSESILRVHNLDDFSLRDDELFRISVFYLLFPLNDNTCTRSRTLIDYGWKQLKFSDELKKRLIKVSDYTSYVTPNADEETIKRKNLCVDDKRLLFGEKGAVEVSNTDSNLFYSILHHIRNCFAHGNYRLVLNEGKRLILFEDHTTCKGSQRITARMILEFTTLLNWIDVVSNNV